MKQGALIVLVVTAVVLGCGRLACAESASSDLTDMSNTGTTFDGSDGERSGMDYDFRPSGGDSPDPTPEPVYTESGSADTSEDYYVDTSSSITTDSPSDYASQDTATTDTTTTDTTSSQSSEDVGTREGSESAD